MAKKKRGRGRPTIINAAERRKVIKLLREYGTRADAARMIGVTYSGLRRHWVEDQEFEKEIIQAELYAKTQSIQRIQRAQDDDWRSAAWMLERKYSKEFSKKRDDALPIHKVAQLLGRLAEKIAAAVPVESHAAIRSVIQFEIEGLLIAKST